MATYLLDTHSLIWWWLRDLSLSTNARETMQSDEAIIVVSAVSAFEIGQKVRMGKLSALRPIVVDFVGALAADGFGVLPLSPSEAMRAVLMPGDHRDPFDRLLAVQALEKGLTVITRDREFATFGCETLW